MKMEIIKAVAVVSGYGGGCITAVKMAASV
jgi:hypothetical protein